MAKDTKSRIGSQARLATAQPMQIEPKAAPADVAAQPKPLEPKPAAPAAVLGPDGLSGESKGFAAISYFLGIFIALIIFLMKKEDKYVRFHAAQAILFDICITVVSMVLMVALFIILIVAGVITLGFGFMVGFLGMWVVFMVYGLLLFALRLFFAWKAYHGEMFKLPILGNEAEKLAGS